MPTEYTVFDGDELVEVFDDELEAEVYAANRSPLGESYRVESRHYNTTEENSAEDNDDTTNMNYDFIASDDDAQDFTNNFDTVGSMWTLGDHSAIETENRRGLIESINTATEDLDDDVDGEVKSVLEDAANLVEDTTVSRFECPVCGLGHSHPDHKHDIRASFNVRDGFADQMDFCPYCHCGVNELAMLVDFFPYINVPVFEDQDDFEEVYEVEPDNLQDMIRAVVSGEKSPEQAPLMAAESRKQSVRQAVTTFLNRVRSIKNAADSAPIAQETRAEISESRDVLEEVLA